MNMFNRYIAPISLLLLASLFSGSALSAPRTYKWVDEAGTVHYSEKMPSEASTEGVTPDSRPKVEPAPGDTSPVEIPQPVNPQASQQLAERCQGLYRDLESYISGQQVTDSEGNVIIVSEEMREAKITEIKTELDQSCR
jgi:hypothetical protein